jgi:biofilm PGA synthesis N-glycosyltransferase PgaC
MLGMIFITIAFWVCLSVMFFCYIGYGLILLAWNSIRKRLHSRPLPTEWEKSDWPRVTMIIAAYNEASVLQQKLQNTLAIDYPREKLQIIFVTDGSTDGSERILASLDGIEVSHEGKRKGKLAAINRIMRNVQTPYVVFSDANSFLNKESIKRIILRYQDPMVGGVAGEKKIARSHHPSTIGEAEGLYWQYESFMKKQDADLNTVVGAAGELFSIRTDLFESPDQSFILDDLIISMQICLKGYRIDYEPGAFATEFPSASLQEEVKRKIRIAAGAYQTIAYLKDCLNPIKFPLLSFQYFSRRLLRWIFCPLSLIAVLIFNIVLSIHEPGHGFYTGFLAFQLFFYGMALLGWIQAYSGRSMGILGVPFYFIFMNICLVRGFIRYIKKDQTVLWEKSLREVPR